MKRNVNHDAETDSPPHKVQDRDFYNIFDRCYLQVKSDVVTLLVNSNKAFSASYQTYTLGTLPAEYRPARDISVMASGNDDSYANNRRLSVRANGAVEVSNNGGNFESVNAIGTLTWHL